MSAQQHSDPRPTPPTPYRSLHVAIDVSGRADYCFERPDKPLTFYRITHPPHLISLHTLDELKLAEAEYAELSDQLIVTFPADEGERISSLSYSKHELFTPPPAGLCELMKLRAHVLFEDDMKVIASGEQPYQLSLRHSEALEARSAFCVACFKPAAPQGRIFTSHSVINISTIRPIIIPYDELAQLTFTTSGQLSFKLLFRRYVEV